MQTKNNQSALARKAKVTQGFISQIISGKRRPGPEVAFSLGEILNCDPMIFFKRDTKKIQNAFKSWTKN